jgi:predicted nucleotidyltransferase
MLKRRLRRFVVWSSRPPLTSVYQEMYRMMIRLAVLVLKRYQGIMSIYLCRGCAKNDITPGISDIDLALVTTNDDKDRRSIQKACHALGRATGHLIEYYPKLVATRETLERRWYTTPCWQYRYHEGKATWKLLYGTDVLSSLPELTKTQRKSSCYAEMNRWWLMFVHLLLKPEGYRQDVLMRNVTCYKAVSELLNAQRALRTEEYQYSRAAGLESDDTPLAKKLAHIAEQRFMTADDQVMEETYHFLLTSFVELWEGFHKCPWLHIYHDVGQGVDCPKSELQLGEKGERHVEALHQHVETHWGPKCRGTNLVKSAFWNMEDLLLVIDVDRNLVPTVGDLADLVAVHCRIQGEQCPRIFLFLRIGSVAFPLTPEIPRDLHRGLLTPATMPDVFLQLGHTEVYWTDYTKWYLSGWRSNEQWPDAPAHKRLQLSVIARSAETGHITYPLTLAALEREKLKIPDLKGIETPSNHG